MLIHKYQHGGDGEKRERRTNRKKKKYFLPCQNTRQDYEITVFVKGKDEKKS